MFLAQKYNYYALLCSQQDTLFCPACLSARNLVQMLLLRLAIVANFGRKRVIFFKARLCISAFRNRKDGQKIFAAQTPPRKRGYVEDFTLKSVNALSKIFFSSTAFTKVTALLLRYVHVAYGKIAARQARGWGWYLIKICLSQL